MNKRVFFLFFLFPLIAFQLSANKPPVKYWVKFKDKSGTPFSVENPSQFLTDASIKRRLVYNITIDFTDLPVTPSYISQISTVAHVRFVYASKWLNGAVIEIDSIDNVSLALSQIGAFSFVESNQKVHRYAIHAEPLKPDDHHSPSVLQKNTASAQITTFDYGRSGAQIRQLGLECLHNRGYRGQGMTIGVLDNGFASVDQGALFDSVRPRILGGRDFVSGGNYPYQGGAHGTAVFSCMAANKPGLIMGTAPMASYWLLRTEAPDETISEEYNWIRGAEFADSVGCDILTTSLGYTEFDDPAQNHTYETLNGRTAPMSIAATMAARKGLLVLNAAGNERASSWHFIGVPADADSIITVGAVDSLGTDALFSSVGPTADGRIKPDLSAMGVATWVTDNSGQCFPGNGTSFATPVLAGAVACYWQANRQYNNILVQRRLKQSASRRNDPNNLVGWGIPNLCSNLPFEFAAYSDPVTSVITVELIESSSYESQEIEICDMLGRVLLKNKLDKDSRVIYLDSPDLAQGVYLVRIKTSGGEVSKKILKL
jgi:serine protease AprX